jgi:uncharacterized membrane protein YfbV (UPF0208 family)
VKYPLSLALFDFVPVILNLLAQVLLLTELNIDSQHLLLMALCGIILMNAGGALKAAWKTIIAATGKDIRWMEHALFLGLAPGACLFAWVIWNEQRLLSGQAIISAWPLSLLIIAVFLLWSVKKAGASGKWFMPLVALLTVSMGIINVNAFLIASYQGANLAAGLFILSFSLSLLTSAVSRKVATIRLQWFMEAVNSLSALCFLFAVILLQ